MRKTRQKDKAEFEYAIKELFDWEEYEDIIVIILRNLGYTKLSQLISLDNSTL